MEGVAPDSGVAEGSAEGEGVVGTVVEGSDGFNGAVVVDGDGREGSGTGGDGVVDDNSDGPSGNGTRDSVGCDSADAVERVGAG